MKPSSALTIIKHEVQLSVYRELPDISGSKDNNGKPILLRGDQFLLVLIINNIVRRFADIKN